MIEPSITPFANSVAGTRATAAGSGHPCALEARGLTFRHGRYLILRDVTLCVGAGEIVALLGSNGAGKSTLLQCLAGVLRPAAGEVHWLGEAVGQSPSARGLIGFLGHECGLYLAMTARENLSFAGHMYGVPDVASRVAEFLSAVGLNRYARERVACLSRGMRQRLAIARATLHHPAILLLDEPYTSLDTQGRAWLTDFLGGLRQQGCAIVLATHNTEQSTPTADRLLCLQGGRLHAIEHPSGEQPIHRKACAERV